MKFLSPQPNASILAAATVRVRDDRSREEKLPYRAPATAMQAVTALTFTDTVTKKSEKGPVAAFARTQAIFPPGEENVNQTWSVKPISSRYQ